MTVDNGRNITTRATTTGPVIDWFANVVKIDPAPETDGSIGGPGSGHDGSDGHSQNRGISGFIRRLVRQYRRLPGWVLILQIFLAFAWGRSGLAHALDGSWWSGQQILDFLATETGLRVDAYQHVLAGVVEPMPTITAVVVVIIELGVALLLLLNHRTPIAIALAIFLNLQIILAGVVTPSLFYLVAALGIAIWRLETLSAPKTVQRVTRNTVVTGVAATAFLAPSVRTLQPEGAIEDPALVLIFVALLSITALWWVNRRVTLADETLAALTDDGELASLPDPPPRPATIWLVASAVGAALILLAGFGVLTDEGRADATEDLAPETARSPGSFDNPYPFGQNVTLSYRDLTDGQDREWTVQLLETLLDGSNPIQSDPAIDGQLAMARIRLSYREGSAATAVSEIQFNAIGQSGTVFTSKTAGCGSPEGRLDGDRLSPGEAIEGWVCWPVPTEELSFLVVAVEAKPADGVLYMALQ